jgi:hypothetical protein
VLTPDQLAVLDAVKRAIGADEYQAFEHRWERAAAEDLKGLQKSLRDLAMRRGTIRSPAGWLWGAYRREHDGHVMIAGQRTATRPLRQLGDMPEPTPPWRHPEAP